jgi:POT family proton-dependent oligopeptide transporter
MKETSSLNIESNDKIISINRSKAVELEPTVEELATLEHILDSTPLTVWSMIFCEMCEGFASMGTYQIMQNYVQFPVPTSNSTQPGALGRGQQTATALTTSYCTFCFLTPIAAGIIADQFLGRYKTIVISCFIYIVGLIILVLASIPASIENGIALPGLICGMITMGVATGGFKTASGPFMAEQYTRTTPVIKG